MQEASVREMAQHPLREDPRFAIAMAGMPHKHYIEITRDGNCLYASFAKLIYPHLLGGGLGARFFGLGAEFERADVSSVVHEAYTESLQELLAQGKPAHLVTEEEWTLFIGYLRLATSTHILNNAESYTGFLADVDLQSYVRRCVDPMGGHSGQVEIIALSRVFGFRLTVFYLSGEEGLCSMAYGEGPPIAILHSPGHFEPVLD